MIRWWTQTTDFPYKQQRPSLGEFSTNRFLYQMISYKREFVLRHKLLFLDVPNHGDKIYLPSLNGRQNHMKLFIQDTHGFAILKDVIKTFQPSAEKLKLKK